MSESEYFEAPSDSFWEINQYKRVVKRTEDGHRLSNDLMQMLSERAAIEKAYSKNLKIWSKKWSDYLEKSCEYGTMKATWHSIAAESNSICEMHHKIHDDIEETLLTDIKAWQKQNYPKTMVSSLKIVKQYEEEFAKAQKPWAKKYTQVEKAKKEYHSQCKLLQTAKVAETNSKTDASLSADQKKKMEDKVEKHRKEVENAKHKYQLALDDLNQYNARYIEDMKAVYKKCDTFEKQRLDYFIQKFHQVHGFVDLTQKPQINTIYTDFMQTIKSTNPDKDLLYWSKTHGAAMGMNWPVFEEYSEEFKNIAKGEKRSKLTDDNGITMTGIKQKEEQIIPDTSVLRSQSQAAAKKEETNPFGDDDSDDDTASTHNHNSLNRNNSTNHSNNNNNNNTNIPTPNNYSNHNHPPINHNETQHYLHVKVRAIYDYNSTEDDELTFKAGEEFIKLLNEDDRGWCLGKIGEKTGLYPATYAVDQS